MFIALTLICFVMLMKSGEIKKFDFRRCGLRPDFSEYGYSVVFQPLFVGSLASTHKADGPLVHQAQSNSALSSCWTPITWYSGYEEKQQRHDTTPLYRCHWESNPTWYYINSPQQCASHVIFKSSSYFPSPAMLIFPSNHSAQWCFRLSRPRPLLPVMAACISRFCLHQRPRIPSFPTNTRSNSYRRARMF